MCESFAERARGAAVHIDCVCAEGDVRSFAEPFDPRVLEDDIRRALGHVKLDLIWCKAEEREQDVFLFSAVGAAPAQEVCVVVAEYDIEFIGVALLMPAVEHQGFEAFESLIGGDDEVFLRAVEQFLSGECACDAGVAIPVEEDFASLFEGVLEFGHLLDALLAECFE